MKEDRGDETDDSKKEWEVGKEEDGGGRRSSRFKHISQMGGRRSASFPIQPTNDLFHAYAIPTDDSNEFPEYKSTTPPIEDASSRKSWFHRIIQHRFTHYICSLILANPPAVSPFFFFPTKRRRDDFDNYYSSSSIAFSSAFLQMVIFPGWRGFGCFTFLWTEMLSSSPSSIFIRCHNGARGPWWCLYAIVRIYPTNYLPTSCMAYRHATFSSSPSTQKDPTTSECFFLISLLRPPSTTTVLPVPTRSSPTEYETAILDGYGHLTGSNGGRKQR